MTAIMHPQACLLYKHILLPPKETKLLRDTEMKHELISLLMVSPILNPGALAESRRLLVFINRQREEGEREKGAQQMTETIWKW